jgi:hypothetical protein
MLLLESYTSTVNQQLQLQETIHMSARVRLLLQHIPNFQALSATENKYMHVKFQSINYQQLNY